MKRKILFYLICRDIARVKIDFISGEPGSQLQPRFIRWHRRVRAGVHARWRNQRTQKDQMSRHRRKMASSTC